MKMRTTLLQMLADEDQEPIQTLRANRPHESLRDAVSIPVALEDAVKLSVNF
jgi:hypothetical protein